MNDNLLKEFIESKGYELVKKEDKPRIIEIKNDKFVNLFREKEYYRKDAIFWEEKCNKYKEAYDKQKEMLITQDKEMERLTLENKKLKSELESINQEIRKRMRE